MDELINRKYLYDNIAELESDVRKKLIATPRDSEAYIRYVERLNERSVFKQEIMAAPTVDAVQVVRCKNCKHWGTGVAVETEHVKCCEYAKYMVGENGYCVYGEQRKKVIWHDYT